MKKFYFLIILLLCGCSKDTIITKIEVTDNYVISINYPITNIKEIDKKIKNFIDIKYKQFKNIINDNFDMELSELNINFEYIINENYITVDIESYMYDAINNKEYFDNLKLDTKKEIEIKKEENNYDLKERYIDVNKKIIALTFDDGPSYYTQKILDVLNKYNIKATFFVIGNKVKNYSETLKKILDNNCELGNHTYNHRLLSKMSNKEINNQLNKAQDIIKLYTGYTPKVFRPSYGILRNSVKKEIDLDIALWNIDTLDWKYKSYKTIAARAIKNAKDMGIILMHDTYKRSYMALPIIIEELLNEGYTFVTISEYNRIKELRKNG